MDLYFNVITNRYSTRTFNVFKKSGIPGPTPYPMIGTSLELYGDVSVLTIYIDVFLWT